MNACSSSVRAPLPRVWPRARQRPRRSPQGRARAREGQTWGLGHGKPSGARCWGHRCPTHDARRQVAGSISGGDRYRHRPAGRPGSGDAPDRGDLERHEPVGAAKIRANRDGTDQRRKYRRQPTQIPWPRAASERRDGAGEQPAERRLTREERDAGEEEERRAERLGEPRRVLVLELLGPSLSVRLTIGQARPGRKSFVPKNAEMPRFTPTRTASHGRFNRNATPRMMAEMPAPRRMPRGSMDLAGVGVSSEVKGGLRSGGRARVRRAWGDEDARGPERRSVRGLVQATTCSTLADARRRQEHCWSIQPVRAIAITAEPYGTAPAASTRVGSLEAMEWSGRRGSNPRHAAGRLPLCPLTTPACRRSYPVVTRMRMRHPPLPALQAGWASRRAGA